MKIYLGTLAACTSAFAYKPKLVLSDEPGAGLPTAEAAAFADIIRKLSVNTNLSFVPMIWI